MGSRQNNPAGNNLGTGISIDQLRMAVEKSGYPLQTEVGSLLRETFSTQDEWCYVDRDSGDLRSLDIRADMRLHGWSPQPRVRPQLTLVAECKQSELPYVFFESVTPQGMLDHPKICGLHKPTIRIATDDDRSKWTFTIIHALELHQHPFQTAPVFCSTFSKAVRKGKEIELSGTEAYSGLVLPLIKGLEHLAIAEAPPPTAWYFDAHLSIGLGVLDAPMILVNKQSAGIALNPVPWVRVLRHEYSADGESRAGDRLWAIDVVHRDFLREYVAAHLLPFAKHFASRVLAHPTEIASGEAFAAGMGANSWNDIEVRLKPREQHVAAEARAPDRKPSRSRKAKGKREQRSN